MAFTIARNIRQLQVDYAGFFWFVSGIAMTDIPYMEKSTVADRIRARLEALNKNPSAVALEAGLSRSSVLDILKGKAANPRLDTLQKLTGPLECSLEYLTGASPIIGASPFSAADHALHDIEITHVQMNLETGVFREGYTFWPDDERLAISRDPRAPERRISAYRMGDHSLAGLSILQGDILHVLDYGNDEIILQQGMIVVVRKKLEEAQLTEMSARYVHIDPGATVLLISKPIGDEVPLPILLRLDDQAAQYPNTYFSSSGDLIEIEGVVGRVVRTLKI